MDSDESWGIFLQRFFASIEQIVCEQVDRPVAGPAAQDELHRLRGKDRLTEKVDFVPPPYAMASFIYYLGVRIP
jgi:hypothetical protein